LIGEHVAKVSGRIYVYSCGQVLDNAGSYWRPSLFPDPDPGALCEDLDAVRGAVERIDAHGLAFIATRLAADALPFLRNAGLDWHHPSRPLDWAYTTPGKVNEILGYGPTELDFRLLADAARHAEAHPVDGNADAPPWIESPSGGNATRAFEYALQKIAQLSYAGLLPPPRFGASSS
jgi:hypothetical protein